MSAEPESRGIDIKIAEDGSLILLCLLLDSGNNKVDSSTTEVRIWHIVPGTGVLEGYDFDDDTFKSGALTTDSASATHCAVDNSTYSTGVWSYRHTTLTDFVDGHQYIFEFYNALANPMAIPRWAQYGWGDDVWGAPRGPGGILQACAQVGTNGLTFADLKARLNLMVDRGWEDEARFISPDLIAGWINSGYQEVDRKLRWTRCTYSFTTEADVDEYAIPTSVREYLAVEYLNDDADISQLEEISLRDFIARRRNSIETGQPLEYVHHGDRVELYPMPDTTNETVKIWAVLEPDNLASDADTPGFPVHLHELIIDLAVSYVCRHFKDFARATELQNFVEGELMKERKEPAMDRENPKRVRPPSL